MEHDISQEIPKAGKDTDAQDSHVQAVAKGSQDSFPDVMFPSVRLGPCHCRQQDHCHGIGNGGWKKDKGGKRYNRDKVRKTDVNAVIYRVFLILSLFLYQYVLFLI